LSNNFQIRLGFCRARSEYVRRPKFPTGYSDWPSKPIFYEQGKTLVKNIYEDDKAAFFIRLIDRIEITRKHLRRFFWKFWFFFEKFVLTFYPPPQILHRSSGCGFIRDFSPHSKAAENPELCRSEPKTRNRSGAWVSWSNCNWR